MSPTPITDCAGCGHPKFYHERLDELGHVEPCRCTAVYGGGKFRCDCSDYVDAREVSDA